MQIRFRIEGSSKNSVWDFYWSYQLPLSLQAQLLIQLYFDFRWTTAGQQEGHPACIILLCLKYTMLNNLANSVLQLGLVIYVLSQILYTII